MVILLALQLNPRQLPPGVETVDTILYWTQAKIFWAPISYSNFNCSNSIDYLLGT